MKLKPISTSLSPNTERDDVSLALRMIFKLSQWKQGEDISKLERKIKDYLGIKFALSFNSGRTALMAILDAIGIKRGDEVLLQGFTCSSAVNPILDRGAKPIFVDIDETLNIDPEDLRKKITSRSKVVIVQHSFGWPAQMEEIAKITREKNLSLVEDCAHSFGAKYNQGFSGMFGKAAFFSFGRDKVISSIFGGMAVTNDNDLAQKIKVFRSKIDHPSSFWIFQQLLHPILINYVVLPAYGLNQYLGRIVLGTLHKLSILSKAVYKEEKRGKICKYFPKKLSNSFATLALNQLGKIDRLNRHRRKIASLYRRGLKETNFILPLAKERQKVEPVFMRYPILTDLNTDEILKEARKKKIYLNDGWRKSPIVPPDTDIKKMEYIKGSCPNAEKVAECIINLPTNINISENEAQRIIGFLKKYGN